MLTLVIKQCKTMFRTNVFTTNVTKNHRFLKLNWFVTVGKSNGYQKSVILYEKTAQVETNFNCK